jgi:hypothetical protein
VIPQPVRRFWCFTPDPRRLADWLQNCEVETVALQYDIYQRRVAECDQQLQKHLRAFADRVPPPVKEALPAKKKEKQNKTILTSISPMNYSVLPEWI